MDAKTERDLVLLRAQREGLERELQQIDLEIGQRAYEVLTTDEYASKSSLGRILGFSHTHIGNLVERARSAPAAPARERIPVMENTLAGEYVMSIGARVIRSVSGFHAGDVLVTSGLDPRLFAEEGQQRLNVPYMLWHLDTGDWVGVSQATVGYGGTGCDYARSALERAGISRDAARTIVRWRYCDAVNVDDETTWKTSQRWPVSARSTPIVMDDRMIVPFGDGLSTLQPYQHLAVDRHRDPVDETGFYPSVTEESHLEAWLRFLDDSPNLPDWARGERVARVFRNAEAAAEDGFVATSKAWGRAGTTAYASIVIEQGNVQLWGFYYRPRDTTQYLPEEAYQVLSLASVYPADLATRDERAARPWSRFVAGFVPHRDGLPDRIDVSVSAGETLAYLPTEPIVFYG